jgi:lanosterol synthase
MVTTRAQGKGSPQGTPNATPNGKTTALSAAKPAVKRRNDATNDELDEKPRKRQLRETDISRWRCLDEEGRLTWHYLEDDDKAKEWPQSIADKWYLGLDLVSCLSPIAATA